MLLSSSGKAWFSTITYPQTLALMISSNPPTDRTPLLRNDTNNHISNTEDEFPAVPISPLPSLESIETELRARNDDDFTHFIMESVQTTHFPSPATGSSLIILICLREIQRKRILEGLGRTDFDIPRSLYDASVESPRSLAITEWSKFISWATADDIQEFLWTGFPVGNEPGNEVAGV